MDAGRGRSAAKGDQGAAPRRRRKRGELHLYKRGGYWWARGTLGIRQHKFSYDRSLGLAPDTFPEERPPRHVQHALAALRAELTQRAIWGDEGTRTWPQAAKAYLKGREAAVTAKGWDEDPEAVTVEAATRFFGPKLLTAITTAEISAFLDQRGPKNAKPETIRRILSPIGAILHLAHERGWLKAVPHIPRPPQPKRTVSTFLRPDEVRILIEQADDHIKALLADLFLQGPRGGEPLKLEWEHVDLGDRPRYRYADTKNGEPRALPMHPVVAAWLRWERARQARKYDRVPSGRIYVNRSGRPWHVPERKYGGVIRKSFDRAVRGLVIELWMSGQEERAKFVSRCTPHWGRHTFASLRRLAGQDRRIVQLLGGWKDQRSMDPYDHLDDEDLRAALEFEIVDTKRLLPPPEAENA